MVHDTTSNQLITKIRVLGQLPAIGVLVLTIQYIVYDLRYCRTGGRHRHLRHLRPAELWYCSVHDRNKLYYFYHGSVVVGTIDII